MGRHGLAFVVMQLGGVDARRDGAAREDFGHDGLWRFKGRAGVERKGGMGSGETGKDEGGERRALQASCKIIGLRWAVEVTQNDRCDAPPRQERIVRDISADKGDRDREKIRGVSGGGR